jgi:nitrite reductase/ring-hydroxylating ferredoxin subunit
MPDEFLVARAEDLPEGTHRIVRVANREIGIFNVRGDYYALPNLCPHQRGPLCSGNVSGTLMYGPETDWKLAWVYEDEVITCPWHSLEFHIPTGRCIALRGIQLRTYDVRVVDGEVRIWI